MGVSSPQSVVAWTASSSGARRDLRRPFCFRGAPSHAMRRMWRWNGWNASRTAQNRRAVDVSDPAATKAEDVVQTTAVYHEHERTSPRTNRASVCGGASPERASRPFHSMHPSMFVASRATTPLWSTWTNPEADVWKNPIEHATWTNRGVVGDEHAGTCAAKHSVARQASGQVQERDGVVGIHGQVGPGTRLCRRMLPRT